MLILQRSLLFAHCSLLLHPFSRWLLELKQEDQSGWWFLLNWNFQARCEGKNFAVPFFKGKIPALPWDSGAQAPAAPGFVTVKLELVWAEHLKVHTQKKMRCWRIFFFAPTFCSGEAWVSAAHTLIRINPNTFHVLSTPSSWQQTHELFQLRKQCYSSFFPLPFSF